MLDAIAAAVGSHSFWLYATIPIVSALVGWGTNKVAIQMMFYPVDPIGKPPFLGWHGIIPSKAEKMATKTVDKMTTEILTMRDIFDKLEPDKVVEQLEPILERMFENIIDEVMEDRAPRAWKLLPKAAKAQIHARAKAEAPETISAMMEEIGDRVDELLDLKRMSIAALVADKDLLNRIFQRCGAEEFKLIATSGFYFGFAFGLVQMVAWIFLPEWWILPAFGLLVGYATNWMALKMIFEPLEPTKFGPFTYQGLFLKRQKEVSAEYASLITAHIINPTNLMGEITDGPGAEAFRDIVKRHMQRGVDAYYGAAKPFVEMALGQESYETMKGQMADRVIDRLPASLMLLEGYSSEAMDIENTLREKMSELHPRDFEGLLRGAFQEDEILLILVGAVLGVLVGFGQLVFVFS